LQVLALALEHEHVVDLVPVHVVAFDDKVRADALAAGALDGEVLGSHEIAIPP